nr:hypothetical protein [Tanacetum cinerariifolium]
APAHAGGGAAAGRVAAGGSKAAHRCIARNGRRPRWLRDGDVQHVGRGFAGAAFVEHRQGHVVGRGAGVGAARRVHKAARNGATGARYQGRAQRATRKKQGARVAGKGGVVAPGPVEQYAGGRHVEGVAIGLRSGDGNGERAAGLHGKIARNIGGGARRGGQHGWRGGRALAHYQLQVAPGGADEHIYPVDEAVFFDINGHYVLIAKDGAVKLGNARTRVQLGRVGGRAQRRAPELVQPGGTGTVLQGDEKLGYTTMRP